MNCKYLKEKALQLFTQRFKKPKDDFIWKGRNIKLQKLKMKMNINGTDSTGVYLNEIK